MASRYVFIAGLVVFVLAVFAIVELTDTEIQNVGSLVWFPHHNLGIAAGVTALWTIFSGVTLKGRVRRNEPIGRMRWWHIGLTTASVVLSALAWGAGVSVAQEAFANALRLAHGGVGVLLIIFGVLSIVTSPCVSHMTGRREVHSNVVSVYIALAVLQVLLGFGRII